MVVTLIGYRGSGKTAVAKPLARRLGWDWIDADDEIERRAARTIREIFAQDGEPAFRALECQVMAELLARDRLVIAAGGGAVLDPDTRREMSAAGPVVWLQADAGILYDRICSDPKTAARRPSLSAGGGRLEIETLLAQREPLYRECATLIVDTGPLGVDEVVEVVLRSLPQLAEGGRRP
jgi:shikimate kinase